MSQNTCTVRDCYRVSIMIICLFGLIGNSISLSTQKVYQFTHEHYMKRGTTGLVVGGILIVGGTIGTIAHDAPESSKYSSPLHGHVFDLWTPNQPPIDREVSMNLWPAVIAGRTLVSIIGLDRLVKSKRMSPMVAIQKINGMEHMGIKYGKLPSVGIKYSF